VHFAYQLFHPQITPDIVLAAKPIACGIPLAVTIANEKAAATIKPGMHGSTYAGGPLACRVAMEFFDILDELLPSIRSVGAYFRAKLEGLARSFSFIKEVRGQGLMLGVELNIPGKQLVLDGIQEGLLFNCTHETVLRFLPPYIITEKEVDKAIRILKRLFQKAEKQSRGQ
jgi:acetylornithine/N-succinyldiaminopimelate aminotransferase